MLSKELLEKIGFLPEDSDFIIEYRRKCGNKISKLAAEYVSQIKPEPFVPYDGNGRNLSRERAERFIKEAQGVFPDENPYVISLVFWLSCIPYVRKLYGAAGISDEIFYEGMKDFSYKAKECKSLHGVCGVFTNWFFLFFDIKEITLGRLQYEVSRFECEEYLFGEKMLRRGDVVYSCHIPSSGRLTREMCMDSFERAYEFFKSNLSDDIIPITCHTWLLYKPYLEKVFPEGSNLSQFARLFDVIEQNEDRDFYDSWRVFGKPYAGTTEGLPGDNTLRRNFVEYIERGGDFGEGYGVILYDGKKKEIINCGGKINE